METFMNARIVRLTLVVPLVVGCSNIQGTWISKGATETPGNPIGRVTFANDGTFTAEADYGPQAGKRAMSGTYSYNMMNGALNLQADGNERKYETSIKGSELTIWKSEAVGAEASRTGGKAASGSASHKFTMTRLQGKSMWNL